MRTTEGNSLVQATHSASSGRAAAEILYLTVHNNINNNKGKGKVRPITGHEGSFFNLGAR